MSDPNVNFADDKNKIAESFEIRKGENCELHASK